MPPISSVKVCSFAKEVKKVEGMPTQVSSAFTTTQCRVKIGLRVRCCWGRSARAPARAGRTAAETADSRNRYSARALNGRSTEAFGQIVPLPISHRVTSLSQLHTGIEVFEHASKQSQYPRTVWN
ncbi:hypothetical protein BaRGS_00019311 [Batillaria attramentaria]|uniref:Uncharacterized protein n=1 Tax=Batillaria attramentaria TaxID=370345 RepID=A0ABD0KQJ1_9CAEN